MQKEFDSNILKQYEKLDAELDILEKKDKEKRLIRLFILVFIALFIFREPIIFNIKHAFPRVSAYTQEPINPYQEPIKKNIVSELTRLSNTYVSAPESYDEIKQYLSENQQIIDKVNLSHNSEIIEVKTVEKSKVMLLPMAEYSISGRVVAMNHTFAFFRSDFDNVALFDIGLVFGQISDKKFIKKYLKFNSQKIYLRGSRILFVDLKENPPIPMDYISSHFSHTHIIPASSNILSALLHMRKYELIKLDGLLVDVYTKNSHIRTSLSNTDSNETSRGNGACEIMYVTQVQVGNRIYK